jgi:hypothetical protein
MVNSFPFLPSFCDNNSNGFCVFLLQVRLLCQVAKADDVQTALREAKEEIGLDPSLVTVITLLEPFHTKVLFCFKMV